MLLGVLGATDAARTQPSRGMRRGRARFRLTVAALHLAQPIVRTWGRGRSSASARRDLPRSVALVGPAHKVGRGALLLPDVSHRTDFASGLVADLRRARARVIPSTGWERYDARLLGSFLVFGDLVTSSHPEGCVQVAVVRRPRILRIAELGAIAALLAVVLLPAALVLVGLIAFDIARGVWRTGPLVRRVIRAAAVPRH